MRFFLFWISAVLGGGVTWAGILSLVDSAAIKPVPVALNMVDALELLEFSMQQGEADSRILFLGDSTTLEFPGAIQEHLNQGQEKRVRVEAFTIPGQTPFDQYFLSPSLIDTGPDAVIVSINLAAFSRMFAASFGKIELVGMLGPSRFIEAASLPLHWLNATLDQVMLSMLMAQAGGLELWRDLRVAQARVGKLPREFEGWLRAYRGIPWEDYSRALGVNANPDSITVNGRNRLSREASIRVYGAALEGLPEDHPVLDLYSRMLAAFAEAGIPALVYVVPSDIEYLRELGLVDDEQLALSLLRIDAMAREYGVPCVDLHSLLPDEFYVDAGGHFKPIGDRDPTEMVVGELLPRVRELIEGR
ncbi:MAG: hypothetical protein ACYTG5_01610 [Planctomycetota bacterium]|jgi:hypothetical protein